MAIEPVSEVHHMAIPFSVIIIGYLLELNLEIHHFSFFVNI